MEEVKKLLGLGKEYDVEKVEKLKINRVENKYIYLHPICFVISLITGTITSQNRPNPKGTHTSSVTE